MSYTLLEFIRSFVDGRLSADDFVNAYMELWKIERDSDKLRVYPDDVSECLSTTFCLADLYYPESDREEYELDEEGLRNQVRKLLDPLS